MEEASKQVVASPKNETEAPATLSPLTTDETAVESPMPHCLETRPSGESHDTSNEDQPSCPICFQTDEPLAIAPCQHVFCVPCLERVLLSSCADSPAGPAELTDFVSADYPAGREQNLSQIRIPAWDVCPICRQSLFLWDLKAYHMTSENEVAIECSSTDKEHEVDLPEVQTATQDSKDTATTGDYIFDQTAPDWSQIDYLQGSVWLESTEGVSGGVGYGSFHFPPHAAESDADESRAYYNVLESSQKERLFLEDCLYHEASRTLSACLVPEASSTDLPALASSYRLILAFSSDGSFVRSGALVVQHCEDTSVKAHAERFPYDGFWNFQGERTTVVGHKLILNGQPMLLQQAVEVAEEDMGDDFAFPAPVLKLVTPSQRVLGTAERYGQIPVGGLLLWQMKGSFSPLRRRRVWKWQREGGPAEVANRLPHRKIHRWGAQARRWLTRQGPLPNAGPTDTAMPSLHSNTVWGNVFCQGLKVGLASYHFVPGTDTDTTTGSVYISYENPSTSEWPPLDNGQPIPARVYFHNVSFPTPITFRGEILWDDDFGTPWQGVRYLSNHPSSQHYLPSSSPYHPLTYYADDSLGVRNGV
jgi:hypothetical protein